jgi:hypothetical protein
MVSVIEGLPLELSVCDVLYFGSKSLRIGANTCQTEMTGLMFEHAAANSFLAAQRGMRLRSRTRATVRCRADYQCKNAVHALPTRARRVGLEAVWHNPAGMVNMHVTCFVIPNFCRKP